LCGAIFGLAPVKNLIKSITKQSQQQFVAKLGVVSIKYFGAQRVAPHLSYTLLLCTTNSSCR